MGLILHSGNRLEDLADALAEVCQASPLPPLAPEIIVVQSTGMKQWLSIALAERLGVLMNTKFHFAAGSFVESLFAATLPGSPPDPIFRREVLPWRVLATLPGLIDQPAFAELRHYLSGETPALKTFQLARKIAEVFDRYLAFRPELIQEWEGGGGTDWQAILWREVTRPAPGTHLPALARKLMQKLQGDTIPAGTLPARFAIFGLSSLPPFYLQMIGAIARHTEAHLFLLAPTHHYWGDVLSEKEQARQRQWRIRRGLPAVDAHVEQGHPLLASLGRLGREFHEALLDLTPAAEPTHFTPPERRSLLARLQSDIFDLSEPTERSAVPTSDLSIQVHNCHSPLRELEILHDQLLARFDTDPTLKPRDVLVTMPDVEAYAPFIDAVFGAPESERVRFPYAIADRAARTECGVADAFLRVLELVGGRFPSTAVLALLDCPAIRTRFGLLEADLPSIRDWVVRSGIRWGHDAEHRKELGLPGWEENTWRFGLDRLLLGYALPGDGHQLFERILPDPSVEDSAAQTLGRFIEFCEQLFAHTDALTRPRPVADWAQDLRTVLSAFCADTDDFAGEWRSIATDLEDLAQHAEFAGHTAPLAFEVVRSHLTTVLGDTDRGGAFLRGGITFCALKPMRAIPHRIVCLLGLNDGAFPRSERPPGFDLTAQERQPGDRSRRDDDRYLFLEALLSARDALHLSYCGRSAKDGTDSPPSVLITELLERLEQSHTAATGGKLSEQLSTEHPLQAFSPSYFTQGPLFSYSQENAAACAVAQAPRFPPAPLVNRPLPPIEIPHVVTLDQLTHCLAHPSRFFVRERLGLRLPGEEPLPQDVEPLSLDALTAYQIGEDLTASALEAEQASPTLLTCAQASGQLPYGYAGTDLLHTLGSDALALAQRVKQITGGSTHTPLHATLTLGDWQLTGSLADLYPSGHVRHRNARLKGKDFVRAWIAHLFLCATATAEPRRTVLVGREEAWSFRTVEEPLPLLADLLALFAEAHTHPLPFFPGTSIEFTRRKFFPRGRETADPRSAALGLWLGSEHGDFKGQGEAKDVWNALVFPADSNPLNQDWEQLAQRIVLPMLEHREEVSP